MTDGQDRRDPLLARELANLTPIGHSQDFWPQLEARLAEVSGEEKTADLSLPTPDAELVPEVVELRRFNAAQDDKPPGRRGAAIALIGLAAAAIVFVALVGFGRVGGNESVRTDPISEERDPANNQEGGPSNIDAPNTDSPNTGQPRLGNPSPPNDQGPVGLRFVSDFSGDLIGFTPDGAGLLVIADHPGESRGSEGAPHLTVYVVPIDGGEPTIALPLEVTIETGTYGGAFATHPSGHIAWVESCDGYFCGLRTANLAPDGRMSNVTDVEVPQVTSDDVWVDDIALSADGSVYVVSNNQLGVVDPGTKIVRAIDDRQASGVALIEDRAVPVVFAILDGDEVTLGDPEPIASGLGDHLVREVAIAGDHLFVIGFGQQDKNFAIVNLTTGDIDFPDRLQGEQGPDALLASSTGDVVVAVFESKAELIDNTGAAVLDLGDHPKMGASPRLSWDGSAIALSIDDVAQPSGLYLQTFNRFGEESEGQSASEVERPASPLDVEGVGIVEEVANFSTNFDCCQPRTTNIALAAELTHGTIIRAGESFSLNAQLGPRTSEAGFVADGAIVDGTLQPELGGGISQYATTLFNSAFFAGLEFEEYQSHDLNISRYPPGREATLGWPGPDLVIHNQTDYDVLIWNTTTETSLTVTLFSTKHIDVEAGSVIRSTDGNCAVITTPRTRTYPDGMILEDSVFARYRPAEGGQC